MFFEPETTFRLTAQDLREVWNGPDESPTRWWQRLFRRRAFGEPQRRHDTIAS